MHVYSGTSTIGSSSSTMAHAVLSLRFFLAVNIVLFPHLLNGQTLADLNILPHLLRGIIDDDRDLLTLNLLADASDRVFNPTSD